MLESEMEVQVYLRIKPNDDPSTLYEVKNDRTLFGHGRTFTFTKIFGTSSQKEIFEEVVKENLNQLCEGHNFTLLTYGTSGSGKSYTLMGTVNSPGLVPQSLQYIFKTLNAEQRPLYKPTEVGVAQINKKNQELELHWVCCLREIAASLRKRYRRMSTRLHQDCSITKTNRALYYVWVSFVEIYNEGIYDLLQTSDRGKLKIREDANGNTYVMGAKQVFVRSGEEAYDVMVAGKLNLQVAATGVHKRSSRSHCIFTITLLKKTESGVRTSYMRLCDLAGSERVSATGNTGARMAESRSINASLHVLERCLQMKRRKQKVDATLIPYRESKLTRLLGAALSGAKGEKISMVVTLNPSPKYANETKHVLQLAAVAKNIQCTTTTVDACDEVSLLRAENERLRAAVINAQTSIDENNIAKEQAAAAIVEGTTEVKNQYEKQIELLRTEMEKMKKEYEARLKMQCTIYEEKLAKKDLKMMMKQETSFIKEEGDTVKIESHEESLEPTINDSNRSQIEQSLMSLDYVNEIIEVSDDSLEDDIEKVTSKSHSRGTYVVRECQSKNSSTLNYKQTYFVRDKITLDTTVNKFEPNESFEETTHNIKIEENINEIVVETVVKNVASNTKRHNSEFERIKYDLRQKQNDRELNTESQTQTKKIKLSVRRSHLGIQSCLPKCMTSSRVDVEPLDETLPLSGTVDDRSLRPYYRKPRVKCLELVKKKLFA